MRSKATKGEKAISRKRATDEKERERERERQRDREEHRKESEREGKWMEGVEEKRGAHAPVERKSCERCCSFLFRLSCCSPDITNRL